ncbi:MAG: hypothetical protein WD178_08745 [Actinomycetota bacterium]
MFKASIALVLLAFGALAYGWVANNDVILYGSIAASILAGLFLLRATLADRKAGYPEPSRPARPERPAREPRERKPKKSEEDYPSETTRQRRKGGGRSDPGEMTSQMDVSADAGDFLGAESEQATPFRPQSRRRERLPAVPEGAAWADAREDYDDTDFEEEDRTAGLPSYDVEYDEEQDYPPAPVEGAAAADDFRSRLAAVLGSTGEEAPPPAGPARRARRADPRPVPLEDEEDDDEEAPAAAAQRTRRANPRPVPVEVPPPAPKRRGRKKASEPVVSTEPEPEPTEDPEWVRIDEPPPVTRVTQPGGGFARPDVSEEVTHYRPRRPAVAATPPEPEGGKPAKPPASRRRRPAAATESNVRSVDPDQSSRRSSGLTRVSPAEKTRSKQKGPDAPPPRRGRPPKPKP